MAQVINTNIASLNAQRNLSRSQSTLNTSLQRLSSGLRINSAKDDAAGLAISERFTAQIRGLNQAVRNSNDGISLAQTAEGALGEVTNNLQRVRELAVQSVNATNSASDRAAMQQEVSQLIAEIDRVANQTNFNGVKLLDGTFTAQDFQVGANVGETITVATLANATKAGLGLNNGTATRTSNAIGATALNAGDLTINGIDVGAVSADAKAVADAIAATASTITATATNTQTLAFSTVVGTPRSATTSGVGASFSTLSLAEAVESVTAVGGFTQIDVPDIEANESAVSGAFAEHTSDGLGGTYTLTIDGFDVVDYEDTGADLDAAAIEQAVDDFITAQAGAFQRSGTVAGGDLTITKVDGSSFEIVQDGTLSGSVGFSGSFLGVQDNGVPDEPVIYHLQIDDVTVINQTVHAGESLTEAEIEAALIDFVDGSSGAYQRSGSFATNDFKITKADGSGIDISEDAGDVSRLTGVVVEEAGSEADADVEYKLSIDGFEIISAELTAGDELTAEEVDLEITAFINGSSGAYTATGSFAEGNLVISKTNGADMLITEEGAELVSASFSNNGEAHDNGVTAVAASYTFSIDGNEIDLTDALAGNDAAVTGDEIAALIDELDGFTASFSGSTLTITKDDGSNFTITEGGTDADTEGLSQLTQTYRGTVSVTSTGEELVIGGANASKAGLTAGTTAETGNTLTVETVEGANALIAAIDTALNNVNGSRATLGAIQNRFESVVTSLQTSSESLSAARSRIQDTDFASETANLTKSQILQQAGMAMMAQANQLPQGVLSLLG